MSGSSTSGSAEICIMLERLPSRSLLQGRFSHIMLGNGPGGPVPSTPVAGKRALRSRSHTSAAGGILCATKIAQDSLYLLPVSGHKQSFSPGVSMERFHVVCMVSSCTPHDVTGSAAMAVRRAACRERVAVPPAILEGSRGPGAVLRGTGPPSSLRLGSVLSGTGFSLEESRTPAPAPAPGERLADRQRTWSCSPPAERHVRE